MKRCSVVYLNARRLSDFEDQKAIIEDFCKYKFEIAQIFHDTVSPTVVPEKRPAYQEMLHYCSEHAIEYVICCNLAECLKRPDNFLNKVRDMDNAGCAIYWALGDCIGGGLEGDPRREAVRSFAAYLEEVMARIRKAEAAPAGGRAARRPGRPCALDDKGIAELIAARKQGKSIGELCRLFSVSRSTVSKILVDYPELKGEWKGSRPAQGAGRNTQSVPKTDGR
jgi:DNA invertase Pin-like site-specific DNA recombinase